jgi:LysR family glycine cleavage system transcriptional activator
VEIAALPAVAQLWLAPKLQAARAAFPRLSPSIHAMEAPPDLRRALFDLAIFYVRDTQSGGRIVRICDDVIFPACAPRLASMLVSPADLAAMPLLRDTTWTGDWACWLSAASSEGIPVDEGPAFSLYSMAVQAAVDGSGVLMAHEALISGHLASGALIAPFPTVARTGLHLAILIPERPSDETTRLIEWLVAYR